MDELLSIREGARRIHELSDVVIDKYDLHRGLLDINKYAPFSCCDYPFFII